jgi:sugar phosphate isomerase/epimerase
MRIGLSLPTGYLAGMVGDDVDQMWIDMFGPRELGLESLKGLGVTSIELNDIREHTSLVEIERAMDFVNQMKLQISVHLWLPRLDTGELPAAFRQVSQALGAYEAAMMVPAPIHGHRTPMFPSTEETWAHTIRDLQALCGMLEQSNSPIMPTLELSRKKADGPIGITFEEILELVKAVDSPRLGICWDLGHGLSNVLVHGHEEVPPEDFLSQLTHTHIHGVLPNGRTHGPIGVANGVGANNARTGELLNILKEFGYKGIYNLELYPARWNGTPDHRRDHVCRSIDRLSDLG